MHVCFDHLISGGSIHVCFDQLISGGSIHVCLDQLISGGSIHVCFDQLISGGSIHVCFDHLISGGSIHVCCVQLISVDSIHVYFDQLISGDSIHFCLDQLISGGSIHVCFDQLISVDSIHVCFDQLISGGSIHVCFDQLVPLLNIAFQNAFFYGRNFYPTLYYCYYYQVDKYFTVQPHTIIRQHIDYHHWYDRQKMTLKEIHNTQYVSSMNPTAGSFTVDARLQRHFTIFALSFPGFDALMTIYSSILAQHLSSPGFHPLLAKMATPLVTNALAVHAKIASSFLPTAVRFHYIFNLRDLSNIFQVCFQISVYYQPGESDCFGFTAKCLLIFLIRG